MNQINHKNCDNISGWEADGGVATANRDGESTTFGVTLDTGQDPYYFEVGSSENYIPGEVGLVSMHFKWAAAVAGTITFASSNFPAKVGGTHDGRNDVTPYSTTAGDWVPEDPTGAEVEVVGTGNSATGMVITMGGTNAGAAMVHVGNLGSRRLRAIVTITVGGLMRVGVRGKGM